MTVEQLINKLNNESITFYQVELEDLDNGTTEERFGSDVYDLASQFADDNECTQVRADYTYYCIGNGESYTADDDEIELIVNNQDRFEKLFGIDYLENDCEDFDFSE